MKTPLKKPVWVTAGAFLAASLVLMQGNRSPQRQGCLLSALSSSAFAAEAQEPVVTNAPAKQPTHPRLVDLGADKCIPCKMMAPVLTQLRSEYEGRMDVEFIDVWKNPDAGKAYKIKLIPTQIFFDASGKELFRHEGFFSKQDILAKWQELGVDLKSETRHPKPEGSGKGGEKTATK